MEEHLPKILKENSRQKSPKLVPKQNLVTRPGTPLAKFDFTFDGYDFKFQHGCQNAIFPGGSSDSINEL